MFLSLSHQGGVPSVRRTVALVVVLILAAVGSGVPAVATAGGVATPSGGDGAVVAHAGLLDVDVDSNVDGTSNDRLRGTGDEVGSVASVIGDVDPDRAATNGTGNDGSTPADGSGGPDGTASTATNTTDSETTVAAAPEETEPVMDNSTVNATFSDPIEPPIDVPVPIIDLPRLTCGVISEPGKHVIGSFTDTSGGRCLIVAADDVRLVGANSGTTITGPGSGAAISLFSENTNLTVENLTLEGWGSGVFVFRTNISDQQVAPILTARNLVVRDVRDGVGVFGRGTPVSVRLTNVAVIDAAETGVRLRGVSKQTVDGLLIDGVGDSTVEGVALELDSRRYLFVTNELENITIRNAEFGVVINADAFTNIEGLRTENVDYVASASTDAPNVLFRYPVVDGTPVRTEFNLAHVSIGRPATSPDPTTPGGVQTLLPAVVLASTGTGVAAVTIPYDGSVADPFEASVGASRYDPSVRSWRAAGAVDADNKTVRIVPQSSTDVYGVFYVKTVVTTCGVIDAPGVYRIGVIDARGQEDCLATVVDDIHLIGDGPGAGVYGTESYPVFISVDETNVSVSNLTVDGGLVGIWVRGYEPYANPVLENVRVMNTDRGIRLFRVAPTFVNVTVAGFEDVGVDAANAYGLDVDGLTIDGLVNGTPDGAATTNTGLWLGRFDGGTRELGSISGVEIRNTTLAVSIEEGETVAGRLPLTIVNGRDVISTSSSQSAAELTLEVSFDDPTTGEATTLTVSAPTGVVSIDRTATGSPADRPVHLGSISVTGLGPGIDGEATVEFPLAGADVDTTQVSVYRATTTGGWATAGGVVDGGVLRAILIAPGSSTATYAAFGASTSPTDPGDGPSPGPGTGPGACPAIGSGGQTGDLDGDGLCEDVDGDGRFTFVDVIDLVFIDPSKLAVDDVPGIDFNGDGRFTFVDVIDLVFRLQAK